MEVARYIFFQSSKGGYMICTEPTGDPRYKERVWMWIAVDGVDFDAHRTLYENRDQALVTAGMRIEQMEREER